LKLNYRYSFFLCTFLTMYQKENYT
jgi:hypothetical protein